MVHLLGNDHGLRMTFDCVHRYDDTVDGRGSAIASCRVIDGELPWKGHKVDIAGTCGICMGTGLATLQPLIGKLMMIPVASVKPDAEVAALFGTTRSAAVQKCLDMGLPKYKLILALLSAIDKGAPSGEVDALLTQLGYKRAARLEYQQRKFRNDRESRRVNDEKRQYRKTHPCTHRGTELGHLCSTGPIFACAKHDRCSDCTKTIYNVRSCVECGDYRERVEENPQDLFIPCGITTAPLVRHGKIVGHRDTLPRTLASLDGAGLPPQLVTIFAEPESHVPPGWRVEWRQRLLGPWSNLYAGLLQLLRENPHADGFLFVEDDTWLAKGLYTEVCRRGIPDPKCGLIRLFRMTGRVSNEGDWKEADIFCEEKRSDGYQRVRTGHLLWGTNAVLITAMAARAIAADKDLPTYHEDSPDIKLGKLMHRYGLSEWVCTRSLAQTDSRQPSAVGHCVSPRMEANDFAEQAIGAA